ncbi:MAG: hypothetical protein J7K35_07250 [Syntrophobacterales bacterium]|nr:hypothetical protein [Syntrophobacterales bacterium]
MENLTQPIVVGVIVFALSQYFLKLILEPIIQFRKILSDISHTLLFHQGKIVSGKSDDLEMHNKIAELSAQLRSSVYLIPFYAFLSKLKIFSLPKRENILFACRKLNSLSYPLQYPNEETLDTEKRIIKILNEISELLPIETTYMHDEEIKMQT